MYWGFIHSFILFYCKQRHREGFLQIQVKVNETTGHSKDSSFPVINWWVIALHYTWNASVTETLSICFISKCFFQDQDRIRLCTSNHATSERLERRHPQSAGYVFVGILEVAVVLLSPLHGLSFNSKLYLFFKGVHYCVTAALEWIHIHTYIPFFAKHWSISSDSAKTWNIYCS